MCSQCSSREPGRRFAVDGTDRVLCEQCVRDNRRVGEAHETVRRIHRAAHGYDSPCPTCEQDAWLANQRVLEQLETQIMLANLGREPLL